MDRGMLSSSFCNLFVLPFLLHCETANLQKVLFFEWFFNFLLFATNARTPTIQSKFYQKLASFWLRKSTKMALEIDQRTSIDYNSEILPFWDRFCDPLGVQFGSFGLEKGAIELQFSMFGILLAHFLVPRRLGGPALPRMLARLLATFYRLIG